MLRWPSRLAALEAALARSPVVAMLGPRQCGKTTLARQLLPATSANDFNLEDPIAWRGSISRSQPWAMPGHVRGELWNGPALGRSLGVNQCTCRRLPESRGGLVRDG